MIYIYLVIYHIYSDISYDISGDFHIPGSGITLGERQSNSRATRIVIFNVPGRIRPPYTYSDISLRPPYTYSDISLLNMSLSTYIYSDISYIYSDISHV